MKQISTLTLLTAVILLMAFSSPKNKVTLAAYSISLNVKDVKKSFEFYTKLGFKPLNGEESLKQNWIVLTNGKTKIGLFQGMFPQNTLTFNPQNNRAVYKAIKQNGLEPINIMNMDKESGPCTFSLSDPDGNPILFDQH